MTDIPSNDPFWEIIKYLNDHDLQNSSKIWMTRTGPQWIWFNASRGGWQRQLFEVAEWPIVKR